MNLRELLTQSLGSVANRFSRTSSGSSSASADESSSGLSSGSSSFGRRSSFSTIGELAAQPGGNRAVLAIANEISAAIRSIQQPISANDFRGQSRDDRGRFASGGAGQDLGDSVSGGTRLGSVRDDATAARTITASIGEMVRRTFPNAGFAVRPGQGLGGSQVPSGGSAEQSAGAGTESLLSRLMNAMAFTGGRRAAASTPDVLGSSYPAVPGVQPADATTEAAENLATASESLMDSAGFLESLLSQSKPERTSGSSMLGRGFNDAADGFVAKIDDFLQRSGQKTQQTARDRLSGRPAQSGIFEPLTRRLAVNGRRKLRSMFGKRLRRHSMRMASGGGGSGATSGIGVPSGVGGGSGGAGASGGGFGRFMAGMFGGGGGSAAGAAGGGAAGSAGGGGAAAGGMAAAGGLAVAGMVVGVLAFVAAIGAAAKALYALGVQGYETALRVAEYDAALYGAKTQLEINRMFRDMKTANSLSDNGSAFMGSLDKLEDALRPITDFLQNFGLQFLTVLTDVVTTIVKMMTSVDSLIDGFKGLADKVKNNPLDAIKAMAMGPVGMVPFIQGGFQAGVAAGEAARNQQNQANQANQAALLGGAGFGRLREMFEQANGGAQAPPPAMLRPPRAPIPPIGGGIGGGMNP